MWAPVSIRGFPCAVVNSWGLGSELLVKCVWGIGSRSFFSRTSLFFFDSLDLACFPCFAFGFKILSCCCYFGFRFVQFLVESSELGAARRELVVHIFCFSIDYFELLLQSPRLYALLNVSNRLIACILREDPTISRALRRVSASLLAMSSLSFSRVATLDIRDPSIPCQFSLATAY